MIKKAFAAALVALTLTPAVAAAESATVDIRERTVLYADLNLAEATDASELLGRLKRASHTVCRVDRLQPPQVRRQARECKAAALNGAVARVGAPELNALHAPEAPRVMASR